MKRLIFVIMMMPLLWLTSCDLETSDNGDLDGYWQLAQVDTIGGGSGEMVTSRVFWSVQMNLLQVSKIGSSLGKYLLRFEMKDEHLRVYDPYLSARNTGDKKVTDAEVLKPFGIQGLEENFKVLKLDGSKMILESEVLRLEFNKY